jgi:uncharacterized protein (TIGR02246 family)
MTRRICLLAVLLMTLVLLACQPAGPAALSAADKSAIEATNQAFLTAARAGDWAGVAALYTEDAALMPPNALAVEGRTAIQAFFSTWPPVTAFDLQTVEIDGRGDLAYVRGTYTMTITPPGGDPITDSGKFLEIHRRQPDGSWPLYRDMFNSDLALPQPPQ